MCVQCASDFIRAHKKNQMQIATQKENFPVPPPPSGLVAIEHLHRTTETDAGMVATRATEDWRMPFVFVQ